MNDLFLDLIWCYGGALCEVFENNLVFAPILLNVLFIIFYLFIYLFIHLFFLIFFFDPIVWIMC